MRRAIEQLGVGLLLVLYLGTVEYSGSHLHSSDRGDAGLKPALCREPPTTTVHPSGTSPKSGCALCAAGFLFLVSTTGHRVGPSDDWSIACTLAANPVIPTSLPPSLQRRGPPVRPA